MNYVAHIMIDKINLKISSDFETKKGEKRRMINLYAMPIPDNGDDEFTHCVRQYSDFKSINVDKDKIVGYLNPLPKIGDDNDTAFNAKLFKFIGQFDFNAVDENLIHEREMMDENKVRIYDMFIGKRRILDYTGNTHYVCPYVKRNPNEAKPMIFIGSFRQDAIDSDDGFMPMTFNNNPKTDSKTEETSVKQTKKEENEDGASFYNLPF